MYKLEIIFKSSNRLMDHFRFKDTIPLDCRSFVLYQYTCGKCNFAYIGKTFRHFKVRVFEHCGRSLKTHRLFTFNPQNNNNTAVLKHINTCKCEASMDDFKIIGSADNDYHLRLKESLLIQRDNPILNKNVQSIPLKLF